MQSEKPPKSPPKRIAIIGGGISGMACAWKLRHHDCTIDIYESDSRLGGHANSVPFEGNGRSVNVDTGFIAMNDATYPQFNELLSELGVETIPTDMSFGVSTADGRIEWGSYSAWSFLGKLSNLFNLWFWRLAFDVLRFSLFARDIIDGDTSDSGYGAANDSARRARGDDDDLEEALKKIHFEPIGEYLRRQAYSDQFMTYFLIPMVAAPWCVDPDEFARSFPARILIKFMLTHGLLDTVSKTLRWRSFRGGSKTYVDVFQKRFASQSCRIHLNSAIRNVARSNDGVCLTFSNHSSREYDHAVLAVPANQALRLLGDDATAIERKILGSFKTTENMCYLHSDVSLLPKRPSARVAWNCMLSDSHTANDVASRDQRSKVCITFDMNKLQAIASPSEDDSPGQVLVTMNPFKTPNRPQSKQLYEHPLIGSESIIASRYLHKINGVANTSFAGAWMGFGFHEDRDRNGRVWTKWPGFEPNPDCPDLFPGFYKLGSMSDWVPFEGF